MFARLLSVEIEKVCNYANAADIIHLYVYTCTVCHVECVIQKLEMKRLAIEWSCKCLPEVLDQVCMF